VRAKLLFACLALGGLANCAAAVKTDAQPTPAAEAEMAKYNANVGKDYWVTYRFMFCPGSAGINCQFIDVGTHLKIDGLVLNQAPTIARSLTLITTLHWTTAMRAISR
jgi:hypothetical protein